MTSLGRSVSAVTALLVPGASSPYPGRTGGVVSHHARRTAGSSSQQGARAGCDEEERGACTGGKQ